MTSEIMIFENENFGSVRTVEKDGKIYFCGKDIAETLGYSDTAKAIRTHCKGVDEIATPTNGGLFEIKKCFNEKTGWKGTQVLITPKGRETFRLLCIDK